MIEDNQAEVAKQMQRLIAEAKKQSVKPQPEVDVSLSLSTSELTWLPKVKDGEFTLDVEFEDRLYVCCMREPTWREAAMIELYAFRKSTDSREYFSGEYERRELLSKSLIWIADTHTHAIHESKISELTYDFVVQLWNVASKVFFVQLAEAQALYSSAKSFFSGELGHPVHPVILDVDGIIKQVFTFNATEWRSVTMSDYERYQIVWMAYSEMDKSSVAQESISENLPPPDPRLRMLLNRMARQ